MNRAVLLLLVGFAACGEPRIVTPLTPLPDSGVADGGAADGGITDGGLADGGAEDDGGPADADMPDGAADGGPPPDDAGVADASSRDSGLLPREEAALADEAPQNPWLVDSPSAMGHFDSYRRASTYLAGPETNALDVQVRDFEALSGFDIGTSPWHVVSAERYGRPGLRTVWGTGLRYAYKFVTDGARFEFADAFTLNDRVSSIPWNMVALADGRVVFPDIDGFDAVAADDPCRTEGPSLVALRDRDDDPMSPMACVGALSIDSATVRTMCGVDPSAQFVPGSGSALVATYSGALVTVVELEAAGIRASYAVAVAHDLSRPLACGFIADTPSTNASAVEPVGEERSAIYYATEDSIVKMYFDSARAAFTRAWQRTLPIRRRTGTTPTLLDADNGDWLVIIVDGACSVSNVLNGLIVCDDAAEPSQLLAVRREDDVEPDRAVIQFDLPATIRTVENSPAVRGHLVAIANYSGYLPNGLIVPPGGQKPEGGPGTYGVSPDAVEEFATGIVVVRYRPEQGDFVLAWRDDVRQVSGVPLISAGANMVYGTGAEMASQQTYLYGFLLEADSRGPAGTLVVRRALGAAPFRQSRRDLRGNNVIPFGDYSLNEGELYDAGNNTVLDADRSIIMTGGRALVRIRATVQ